jgi:2-phosphoglycolate phosphatase
VQLNNSHPLRAILFDFDGTLADSYSAITASVNHVRATHGLPPLEETEVRRHVGRGLEYLLKHTVPDVDLPPDSEAYRSHHPSVMLRNTRLLPGAMEVLAAAKNAGLRIGVCSNKPRAFTKELLEFLDIGQFIDGAFGPEDVARPKPAPDMLLKALNWLRVPASEALYVGDMVVDIETAALAGITVWVVATGSEDLAALEAAGPDRIMRDLNEMMTLFIR